MTQDDTARATEDDRSEADTRPEADLAARLDALERERARLEEQVGLLNRALEREKHARAEPARTRRPRERRRFRIALRRLAPRFRQALQAAVRDRNIRGPSASGEVGMLLTLLAEKRVGAFAQRAGHDLRVLPKWLWIRTIWHADRLRTRIPILRARAPSPAIDGDADFSARWAARQAWSSSPITVLLGEGAADDIAATRDALSRQTGCALHIVPVSPVADGRARAALGPGSIEGDLVCFVRAGARLDPTCLEMMAAVLCSAPRLDCATVRARSAKTVAACMVPGALVRSLLEERRAQALPSFDELVRDLRRTLHRERGRIVTLPDPIAASADPRAALDPAAPAWARSRTLDADAPLWREGPVACAASLEAVLSRSPRLDADERPHLLAVVPWLMVGGSEVVLLETLQHLAERWRLSIVTTLPNAHAMRPDFAAVTDEIYHVGDVFDPVRALAFVSGLMTARGTRAVLSSNSGFMYENIPELKARHPDAAFLDIVHNDLAFGLIRSAVAVTTSLDHHVAVSRKVGESLVGFGVPQSRVAVVPNGVDAAVFRPDAVDRRAARSRFGIADDSLLLAFAGRLSSEKRPDAFVDIVADLSRQTTCRALVVGDGTEKEALRARVRRERLPVAFSPKMDRGELVHLYAAADVLVLTSTVEGMPLVVLEALATGCPVAATDVGDLRRLIVPGENGFLAPVEWPDDLAAMILDAARAPGRLEAMRAAARRSVIAAGMTRAAMIEGYDRLLAPIAATASGSAPSSDSAAIRSR